MALSLYNKKRHFNKTSEPAGKQKSTRGALKFVIQKHDASHLHYDFRLEMEGVLKSWAIPKGPSLNPEDKRLAMMVEDHPYDYKDFEGIIPAGQYGGGTVIVWDEGTYETMQEGLTRKEQEKLLLQQLHSGDLKLRMHGQKINGDFAFFKLKGRGDNSWLLVKKKDEFATTDDVTKLDQSAKTGKTLADVARENGTEVNHPEEDVKKTGRKKSSKAAPVELLDDDPPPAKKSKASTSKKKAPAIEELLGDSANLAKKASMPQHIVPMMAVLVEEPFDNDNWLYEIKWDGYRAIAYCDGKNVELQSRNLKPFGAKYEPVTDALEELNLKAVLDGEIVAINDKGLPDFQSLQNWQNTRVHLIYSVFDILWLDGYDLTRLPLIERKRILQSLLPEEHEVIKYSSHIEGQGKDFFNVAVQKGLEGIMAKKSDSTYQIKTRSDDWLKIKVTQRQEVVIGGFTKPRNTREFFGALLLGIYDKNELVYVGHTGSGFTQQTLKEMHLKLEKLITDKSPFNTKPKTNQPATWVKPELVCEIKFSEWTKEGIARQPIFMGLRTDKKAKDVKKETAAHVADIPETKEKKSTAASKKAVKKGPAASKKKSTVVDDDQPAAKSRSTKRTKSSGKDDAIIDLSEGEDQKIKLNSHELSLTNLNKVYWKKEGFSKGDMINYYLKIAPYIMPYMMDRPQSLNRYPNGIAAPNFYQKDVRGKVPDWIKTHDFYSESTGETIQYLVCSNEATLIYMTNLGCIEMHPWHSRAQKPNHPDWCLIDLDPDDPNPFEQVIETAHVVKDVLDSIGADSYVKTSGSSGIHIMVPLGAKYTYDQSRQLAELVVNLVHHEIPSFTSLERSPAKRKGKIYLDWLQNRQIQTVAAPYSLRPKPGVPVSTPLDWSEIKKGLTPRTYTAYNIFDKLKADGDPLKPVLGKGIDLQKVLKKVQSLLS